MNPLDYLGGMSGQAGLHLKLRKINIERQIQGLPPITPQDLMRGENRPTLPQTPSFNPQAQPQVQPQARKQGGMNPQLLKLMQLLNR